MISENFPSHFNPQPPTKTPPTTAQPTSQLPTPTEPVKPAATVEPTPTEPVKPAATVEPTPAPAKTRKAINFSSASA